MIECYPLVDNFEHKFLTPSADAPELYIFEAFDDFTARLWISPIKKETAHSIPPDNMPVLIAAYWFLTVAGVHQNSGLFRSHDPTLVRIPNTKSNSDLELSEPESTGDDEDHNPELASSLMVLDLSDSEEPPPRDVCDTKVKGKSRSFETPNNGMSNVKRTHAVLSPDESPTNDRAVAKRLKSESAAISGPLFQSHQNVLSIAYQYLLCRRQSLRP
ncbi:hypothetical protein AZE42_12368 [Rhizopogon vesiculosus]|uniref:Uncharacterized protein n=1 Tax=Rhizopogon vesiculosus TaxID=180088 RepID=A0A1J8Q4F8_9AGAM|nr:hypothetical protein AZE42_12368 [Rhizopogon vesiculosus]